MSSSSSWANLVGNQLQHRDERVPQVTMAGAIGVPTEDLVVLQAPPARRRGQSRAAVRAATGRNPMGANANATSIVMDAQRLPTISLIPTEVRHLSSAIIRLRRRGPLRFDRQRFVLPERIGVHQDDPVLVGCRGDPFECVARPSDVALRHRVQPDAGQSLRHRRPTQNRRASQPHAHTCHSAPFLSAATARRYSRRLPHGHGTVRPGRS